LSGLIYEPGCEISVITIRAPVPFQLVRANPFEDVFYLRGPTVGPSFGLPAAGRPK
jgi:hypothetical protein